jgi:putative membrane protein insertion efficiency factor
MIKKLILRLIRFYQNTKWFHGALARQFFLTDRVCRFTPTCSQYTYLAVEKYGVVKGLWLGLKRIIRCHPWSKGGYDPLP